MNATLPDDVLQSPDAARVQPVIEARSALGLPPPAAGDAIAVGRRPPPAGALPVGSALATPGLQRLALRRPRLGHARTGQFIANVSFDSHWMYVRLAPAHEIALPLTLLPLLEAAAPEERRSWELIHHARGLRWPRLGLVISLAALRRCAHRSDAARTGPT